MMAIIIIIFKEIKLRTIMKKSQKNYLKKRTKIIKAMMQQML